MSQRDLAEAAGLTPAAISRYVNGRRAPGTATVAVLARVLDVRPEDITGSDAERRVDDAVGLIARNAGSLSEAQRAVLIAALARR